MECPDIANLPNVVEGSSNRIYVSLPVYVLALRKLKLGIMLVTDFTANNDLVFNGTSISSLPALFSVGGRPLLKAQVFSISVLATRVSSVWDKMNMQSRLRHHDMCDDRRCDVLQLGIIAIVNFRVQRYQGRLEGFLGLLVACVRRSEQLEAAFAKMHESAFQAFMGRLACYMNLRLYDDISVTFPIELYLDRAHIERNTRPKPASLTPTLHTQASGGQRIHVRDAIYQQQVSQIPSDSQVSKLQGPKHQGPSWNHQAQNHQAQNHSPAWLESSKDSSQDIRIPALHANSQLALPPPAKAQRQVVQTQISIIDPEAAHPAKVGEPVGYQHSTRRPGPESAPKRYGVHRLHRVSAFQLCQIPVEDIEIHATFEIGADILFISPGPLDIFVKPYGKTMRVSPFEIRLGEASVEVLTAAEACTFFGVDEIEMLIHHIHEYSHKLLSLVGLRVKMRVERRISVLANGYERAYWGSQSSMQNLLDSVGPRGGKRILGE